MMLRKETVEQAPLGELPESGSYSEAEVARALVEGIVGLEDGVALFDRHGILVTCNDAYRQAYPLTADLLVPGVPIREILRASAERGPHGATEAEIEAWVEARVERHFWSAGVVEHKLANERWYRITERHTAAGHVLKILTDITEQKRLDEALAVMEARIGEAIGSLDEGIALFGPDDRLVMSNRRYADIFRSVADLIKPGVKFETLIHTAAARKQNIEAILNPENWIERRMERHRQASGSFEHHFSNGQWVMVRERRTADGSIIGTYTDITPLKQREQKLQWTLDDLESAHTRIQNVIDSTSDWIWSSDAGGNVTCNRRSDASGAELNPGRYIAQALANLRAQNGGAANGAPFRNLIHDARLPGRSEIHLRISGNPVLDKKGRFQGYCGAASDVTATVDAQREATRRAAMLQATVDSVAQGIVVFDAALTVQIVNQRALGKLGCPDGAAGDNLDALAGPGIAGRIRAWHEARATQEMHSFEHRGPSTGAKPGPVMEVRATLMPDGGGVMTLTDITERVESEERLRQSQKMAALGHLVGGVAHEFNNLLTSIGGFSKLALEKADQEELVRDCLEEVVLSSDRAADLTRQMLAYGRKQPIETKVFPAARIVTDLERMMNSLLPESIELAIELTDEDAFIESDLTQLSQSLLNLVLNARDAIPAGGRITLSLGLGAMPEDDAAPARPCAIYRVADTGTGIDEAALPQIFDPFFTTKEQGKGTGLGLSFVQGIVERSGGRIAVDSKLGVGTTFTIFLPLVTRAETSDGVAPPAARPMGRETILVGADERGVRSLVRSVLADCGYQVLVAADRNEAIIMFDTAESPPSLLLSDVVLPGPSGPEIAAELRARAPDLKVMFMTGYADRDRPHSHQLPSDDVRLDKPFSPVALASAVRGALDGTAGSRPYGDQHE
jgi:two-component system cell cycle sensor histidine kinase/response regulator CckA